MIKQKQGKRLFTLCVGSCLFVLAGCAERLDKEIVAKVGDRKITREDFEFHVELFPKYGQGKSGLEAAREQLDALIETKLVALEARRRGMDRDPKFQARIGWVRKRAVLRELYKDVVRDKVQISDAELRDAFIKSNIAIRARHIVAKTEDEALRFLDSLKAGVPFEALAKHHFRDPDLAHNGGDLGFFTWGDMDEDFEKAAFALRPGEISPPVKTRWGYHIIKVEEIRRSPFLLEEDFARKRPALQATLRRRKEETLAKEFLRNFMAAKNLTVKGPAFAFLVEVAKKLRPPDDDGEGSLPPTLPILRDEEIAQLRSDVEARRNETLVEFTGGRWTIGDFLNRLEKIPPRERPSMNTVGSFKRGLWLLARNEFLAQEGERRGLGSRDAVQQEIEDWEEDMLHEKFRQALFQNFRITEDEVRDFYQRHLDRYTNPDEVNLREIFVPTPEEAEALYERLRRGEDFAELARKHSRRAWAAKKGGEFGYIDPRRNGKMGEVASRLNLGEISKPFQVEGGYSVVQLLGKRQGHLFRLEEVKDRVRDDAFQEKIKTTWAAMLSDLKKKTPVVINLPALEEEAKKITPGKRIDFLAIREMP